LCSIDSGDVDVRPTPFYESHHRSLWSLQITFTLTESALLIFFAIRVEKLLAWAAGEPTILDLCFQPGASDHLTTSTTFHGSISQPLPLFLNYQE